MLYVLGLGFLFGLRHALDADHIAAVASLATRSRSVRDTVRVGLAWGLGHALTLFAVCAAVLVMGAGFPEHFALMAEFIVGIMLVGLGLDVLRRTIKERLHVHAHGHTDSGYHVHIHSHAGERRHEDSTHLHSHPAGLPRRAAIVGLMHGLAGSAALLLLAVSAFDTVVIGLAYVALFGIGSMLGMAVLSFTMALPLRRMARYTTWGMNGVNAVVGTGTVALGVMVMVETAPAAALWLPFS
jgi:hypothetical protein